MIRSWGNQLGELESGALRLQRTGEISRCKGDDGADQYVPGPGHRSAEPDIKFNCEAAKHAQHRATLIGAPGEHAEKEHPQKSSVGNRGDLQTHFDDAS